MSSDEGAVAWLRAQIEARKALAVAACGRASRPPRWVVRAHPNGVLISRDVDAQPVVLDGMMAPSDAEATHIAANDPQDTIVRCEAELAILDEHGPEVTFGPDFCCSACGDVPQVPFPCRTVRLLASGYKHRPGFPAALAADTR